MAVRNIAAHKTFLDLFLPQTNQIRDTVGAIRDLLSNMGKAKVLAYTTDRPFSAPEFYTLKVNDQIEYHALSHLKSAMKNAEQDPVTILSTEEEFDYISPTEISLPLCWEKRSSHFYIYPIVLVGDLANMRMVEECLGTITGVQKNTEMVQKFVRDLPYFSMITRELANSVIGFIPPSINTVSLIRKHIKNEDRLEAKKTSGVK